MKKAQGFKLILFGVVLFLGMEFPVMAKEGNIGNEVGWEVFRKQAQAKANVFISPLSLHIALSALFEGSRGPIRESAAHFLKSPAKAKDLDPQIAPLLKTLQKEKGVKIEIANALWTSLQPTDHYRKLAKSSYAAEVRSADFQKPELVAVQMNEWISTSTQKMINKVVKASDLAGSVLALANVIYFKGSWAKRFDAKLSSPGEFHSSQGVMSAAYMNQTGQLNFLEDRLAQVVEIPYQGQQLSMIVILPRVGTSLEELEKGISATVISQWISRLSSKNVSLRLPRFSLEWGAKDLAPDLVGAGMPVRGDFTDLGSNDLMVTKVLHKTKIRVNEEGSEAAAASVVVAAPGGAGPSSPPISVHADRPFLFLIRHKASSAWLFIGQVERPEDKD